MSLADEPGGKQPIPARELATLRSLLLLTRDMIANPHHFARDDRAMLLETLEMVTGERFSGIDDVDPLRLSVVPARRGRTFRGSFT